MSVLEVTLLAPSPLPVAPAEAASVTASKAGPRDPRPAPRPQPDKRAAQPDARPAGGRAAPGLATPEQEAEVAGSLGAVPSRGSAPPTAASDRAAESASVKVTPPRLDAAYLSNPPPAYPPAARRAGEQGTVTLRVLVMRDGLPSRVEIEKSSGSRLLDAAARDAVWGWRFAPARHGTDPVEQWMQVPVRFRLEDAPVTGSR
jgi:protein TonB